MSYVTYMTKNSFANLHSYFNSLNPEKNLSHKTVYANPMGYLLS